MLLTCNFDGRNFDPDDGVVQCDRGVRITAGVDDDAGRLLLARLVDEINQLAFAFDCRQSALRPKCAAVSAHSFSTSASVACRRFRAPASQEIEVSGR